MADQMTRQQRKQAIDLQDAIGEIVDQRLRDGMDVEVIREVLYDEAEHLEDRRKELEGQS